MALSLRILVLSFISAALWAVSAELPLHPKLSLFARRHDSIEVNNPTKGRPLQILPTTLPKGHKNAAPTVDKIQMRFRYFIHACSLRNMRPNTNAVPQRRRAPHRPQPRSIRKETRLCNTITAPAPRSCPNAMVPPPDICARPPRPPALRTGASSCPARGLALDPGHALEIAAASLGMNIRRVRV
jgi:hypothetical protein